MTPTEIQQRISSNLPGARIQVTDLTGGEDHYQVAIEAPQFVGLSRIQQHQLVMSFFEKELHTGEVHALSLKTSKPV